MKEQRDEEIGLYDCGDHVEIVFRGKGVWPYEWSDEDLAKGIADHVLRHLEQPLRELGASTQFNGVVRSKPSYALLNQRDIWVSFPPEIVTMGLIREVRKLLLWALEKAQQSA